MIRADELQSAMTYAEPSDNMIAERPRSIGWAPKWNEKSFLQNIDDEVQAVVELGKAKSGLIDSLFESTKKWLFVMSVVFEIAVDYPLR